mmetsp:Transcript_8716/g.22398  ORF Transcript_8716/g.22398 Transcript_8716/m.22398 type:complete len:308 (+) Transcript_8716:2126-3049(+)
MIQVVAHMLLVERIARLLQQQQCCTIALVIPGECPSEVPAIEFRITLLRGGKIVSLACCFVQPRRAPCQLVAVARPRVIERPCIGDAVRVLATIRVGEIVQLPGGGEQLGGVGWCVGRGVQLGKRHRRGRQRRRHLRCDLRARAVGRQEEHRSRLGIYLAGSPEAVVQVAVADLANQALIVGVPSLQEKFCHESQVAHELDVLPAGDVGLRERQPAPSERGGGEGHRQHKLDVIPRVEPAAGKVDSHAGSVRCVALSPPGGQRRGGAAALHVVEAHGGGERVGERGCHVGGRHHRQEAAGDQQCRDI